MNPDPPAEPSLEELAPVYEVAHSHYQQPTLLEAASLQGRPIWDLRMLGWATLSHGNSFVLGVVP
jgi:hypothetical protein